MELKKIDNKLILIYHYSEYQQDDWVRKKLDKDKEATFKRTLTFFKDEEFDLEVENKNIDLEDIDIFNITDFKPIGFVLATLSNNNYYKVNKKTIGTTNQVYIHKEIDIQIDYFIAETKISIFKQIDNLVNEDIYIGGDAENNIPIEDFDELIQNFPTTYEKRFMRRQEYLQS